MISAYDVMTKHRYCSSVDKPFQSLFCGGQFKTPDTTFVNATDHKRQPRNTLYLVRKYGGNTSLVDCWKDLALSNGATSVIRSTIAYQIFKQAMCLPPTEKHRINNAKIRLNMWHAANGNTMPYIEPSVYTKSVAAKDTKKKAAKNIKRKS